MPWDSIDALMREPEFENGYAHLQGERRDDLEKVLRRSHRAMVELAARLSREPWPILPGTDASLVETAVHAQIALGAYRAAFAEHYTAAVIPITLGIESAAARVDARASGMVLAKLKDRAPVHGLDASEHSAYLRLIDRLQTDYADVLELNNALQTVSVAIDNAINAMWAHPKLLGPQIDALRRTIPEHIERLHVPPSGAACLWVLSLRNCARPFGTDEPTMEFSDLHKLSDLLSS